MSNAIPVDGWALAREVDDLSRDVDQLRYSLDSVAEELRRRIGEVDRTAEVAELMELCEGLRQDVVGLEEDAGELAGRVSVLEHTLSKVRRETQWLTSHIRAGKDPVSVDLAGLVREVIPLAKSAANGQRAAATFLTDEDLWLLNYRIGVHNTWRGDWQTSVDEVLAATAALTQIPADGNAAGDAEDERIRVITRYEKAAKRARELAGRADSVRVASEQASKQIAADQANRARCQRVVAAGTKADAQMRTRLRTAIYEAVARHALPPTWFTTAMGFLPGDESGTWMALATDLLAYRATYGVVDLMQALGPERAPDWPADRQAWHSKLRKQLDNYA